MEVSHATQSKRVVITGLGAITPLGHRMPETWEGLLTGRSGISELSLIETDGLPVRIGGEIKDFDPLDHLERNEARRMARCTQFALVAAREALRSAGLQLQRLDPYEVGIEIGTAAGDAGTISELGLILKERGPRHISATTVPSIIANMPACQMAISLGVRGPTSSPVAACATGTYAVGEAMWKIIRGDAQVMLAGGTEALLTRVALAGFARIQGLSKRNEEPERACRPFDAQRDGTVMAEGAAVLILESLEHARARQAPILAEVVGYGLSEDAHHVVAPNPDGEAAARAMRRALHGAGLPPEELDYISAHGTGTQLNDVTETLAIKKAVGEERAHHIPITGLKSMVGHMLGAAGAVALAANVMSMIESVVPPTINLDHPDPACDLDYVPNQARRLEVRHSMANAFGFGGQNGCVVLRRWEAE